MFLASNASNAYPVYRTLTAEVRASGAEKMAKDGVVKADIAYFRAKVAKIATPDEFLKDYRLLKFALAAYNLEDQLQYPARIKAIMKDDPTDPTSLVRRMTSAGYREINAAFDFFSKGVTKLKDASFVDEVVKKFTVSRYEQSLGAINPELSDAVYFERKIGAVRNGYEIIGDPILFDVVKTALSVPGNAVGGKIERLKAWVEKGLDMKRLNEPAYVKKIVERFLVLKDVENRRVSGSGLIDIFA
ncbi:Protein of unknown function DUF1217 [Rhabdaerophilaceae bacterium]